MCRIGIVVWVLLVIALAGLPAGVQAQSEGDKAYANAVIDFHIGGSENLQNDPNDALGPINAFNAIYTGAGGYTSLGGGYIILDMGKYEVILDESGKDLIIFEVDHGDYYSYGSPEDYEVYISQDLNNWKCLDKGRGTTEFDISPTGLNWARYVKIVDAASDVSGRTPGADIDAVKALHFGEPVPTLSLTKSASPHSLKQGQTTTITLTIKNTGTTEITDIEVADTIPTYLTFVSGETSKTYVSLRPEDSREFQYTLQPSDAGTFNLDPATATYADEEGNYHASKSSTVAIEVIPSTGTTPAQVRPTHRAATALSITKSPSLNSIRQFSETIITISIENSGTTDATDIEITDTIHPSFDLISGDFPNPKRYDLIRPGETRDLRYTIRAMESGTFTLDPATITYADEDGNIQEATSEPVSIKVIPSTEGGTSRNPSVSTASVQLHGEKTNVVLGEDILLKLSAVNLITKPTMHVQVIIIPPSGMSVTSSAFAKSGAGQYTTTYELEPGSGKDIEVAIRSNQIGDFDVNGRIIYYFGDDRDDSEDHTLTLPITVRASPGADQMADTSESEGSSTPGFAAVVAVIGLLAAYLRRIRI